MAARFLEWQVSVDEDVIEAAVLQIFADRQVPVGGHLSLEVLRAEWPQTQLRRADLAQAVRGLVFDGELELDEESEGPVLILTPRGHQRLRGGLKKEEPPRGMLATLLSPWKPAPAPAAPAAASLRHTPTPEPGFGRRKTDLF